jgi:hypothetical protein
MDYIITLLVEDIESYFEKQMENENISGYQLNNYTNFEIEQIQMIIYIHKHMKTNTYSYDLTAKNFWYINDETDINDETGLNEIDFFKSSHFDSILDLLENITYVKMNYTFYEKILCSPKQKKKIIKLKKSLSFFPNDNICSVCYEPTQQKTICNHSICLQCRERCIQLQKYNCHICRSPKLTMIPEDILFTL